MPTNPVPSNDQLDPLIRGLLRPEAYDHPVRRFEVLETHISWVILTGDYAYKLKKPVNYGFVDFTTRELRQFCCHEELRLNRRQTEDLYLAVRPVYGPREQATLCGTGEPIDFAVQMRQFSQKELLPEVLARGELTSELLDRLASDVAEFQQTAGVARKDVPYGSGPVIRRVMEENFSALGQAGPNAAIVRQLQDWSQREFLRREAEFARRKSAGKIREGHGDMHLGNMILRQCRIEVFDCLEFNPSLRWIDVISEVAFLVMDLADRGRPDLGCRFLNAWLERTGDYDGLEIWAWYFCYRALVRAKVAALRRRQSDVTEDEARRLERQLTEYLQLAQRITQRADPVLIITQGVSGSGKSYWTQRVAAELGIIRIRSDVERKRLFGALEKTPRPSSDIYSEEATTHTYLYLKQRAAMVLNGGWSVMVDATFLRRSQRQEFQQLARELGVRSCLLAFRADPATLQQRVTDRQQAGRDPSDATLDVLERQLARIEALQIDEGWTEIPVDTDRPDAGERLSSSLRRFVESGGAGSAVSAAATTIANVTEDA